MSNPEQLSPTGHRLAALVTKRMRDHKEPESVAYAAVTTSGEGAVLYQMERADENRNNPDEVKRRERAAMHKRLDEQKAALERTAGAVNAEIRKGRDQRLADLETKNDALAAEHMATHPGVSKYQAADAVSKSVDGAELLQEILKIQQETSIENGWVRPPARR